MNSITLSNGLETIGRSAFAKCESLTSITIPKSVTAIHPGAFIGCDRLGNIYCKATKPPKTYYDSYNHTYNGRYGSYIYIILHVPASAINDYKADAAWRSFVNMVTKE